MKNAFITGISGQIGSYLAELLLANGYEVHGLVRRNATISTRNLDGIYGNPSLHLHYGDICDPGLSRLLRIICPTEVYHLAASSHVRYSFDVPVQAVDVTAMGTLHLLEACRHESWAKDARIYVMCSSEMFGDKDAPQHEETELSPRSPYAAAKVFSYHMAKMYREAYNMNVCCGIVFNTESPRRDPRFVTRKITQTLARIACGLEEKLVLGNMNPSRDWMHAEDCVRGIYAIMQHPTPDDFVLGSGRPHSVYDFYLTAHEFFQAHGLPNTHTMLEYAAKYDRPLEVSCLQADPEKARSKLKWASQISFDDLIQQMCTHDLNLAQQEAARVKK